MTRSINAKSSTGALMLVILMILALNLGPGSTFTLHNMGFGKRMQFVADSNRVWQEFTDCVNNINYVLPMVCRYQDGKNLDKVGPNNLKDLLISEKSLEAEDRNVKDDNYIAAPRPSTSQVLGDDHQAATKDILKKCCMDNCDLDFLAKLCN